MGVLENNPALIGAFIFFVSGGIWFYVSRPVGAQVEERYVPSPLVKESGMSDKWRADHGPGPRAHPHRQPAQPTPETGSGEWWTRSKIVDMGRDEIVETLQAYERQLAELRAERDEWIARAQHLATLPGRKKLLDLEAALKQAQEKAASGRLTWRFDRDTHTLYCLPGGMGFEVTDRDGDVLAGILNGREDAIADALEPKGE